MKSISRVVAFTLLLSATLSAAAASPDFTILRGQTDTVYSAKHTIIGKTTPGNTAAIDGKQVKVYSTGTFGAEVTLKEGLNGIVVDVFGDKRKESRYISVFYSKEKPETKAAAKPEERISEMLFYVKTKEVAYLQYCDGEDRLGGAKMGFLTEGIVLKVVGKIRDLYKVQLSTTKYAYIPQECVEMCDETTSKALTGSWSVSNQGSHDRVVISLPKRVAYTAFTEQDPTRICVDLYNAECNSNWIVQMRNLGSIDHVDFQQIESDVFRVIIKLKQKYSWGYDISYEGNAMVIKVVNAPVDITLAGMTIGIDAGHGGSSPGAISITGLKEKDLNLSMAYSLKSILETKGAKVVLSRTGDKDMTMQERKEVFKKADPDIIVSIHCNAGGSAINPMGTSTYYKKVTDRELARCILDRMIELGNVNYGLVGNFNFSLNGITHCPSVLVETLFMSCLPEEEKLSDPVYRTKMMEQVAAGIEDYLLEVNLSLGRITEKEAEKRSKKNKK